MIKKLNFYLLTTLFFLILTSCSNKDNGTESLIEDKLETMSGKEILRELLIKNNNNIDQLARIFECSPSSLKRILEGKETIATTNAVIEFKNVLYQVLVTKEKTLDELDPYNQTWYKKTQLSIQNNLSLAIIFILITIIISFIFDEYVGYIWLGIIVIIIILFYLYRIAYFFGYWFSDDVVIDHFKNTIDTIWEKPISK